jgi:acetyl-CoA carboxylase biotin carboxylase subunit
MARALRELFIVGLPTSQPFHVRVMDEPEFRRGAIDVGYLDRVGAELLRAAPPADLERAAAVVAALLADERRLRTTPAPEPPAAAPAAPSRWLQAARWEGLR